MASTSTDPIHFTHTDLDGDWMEVVEGEQGAVIWLRPHDGDHGAVAVHYEDLPKLIETLQAILENE
jgi:hypothetical protein